MPPTPPTPAIRPAPTAPPPPPHNPVAGAGELIVRADRPGCRVHLDGKIVGTTPLMETVPIGEHLVAVESLDGRRRWQARITVNSASPTRVKAVFPSSPPLPAPAIAPASDGNARLAWTWITAGLSLVSAGVGTGLMVAAFHDYQEYQQSTDPRRFDEQDGLVRTKRTGGYVALGAAGGLAVVALILHLTRPARFTGDASAKPGPGPATLSFHF